MTPVPAVFPRPCSLSVANVDLAEDQPEYETLPVAVVANDARVPVLIRLRLSPEDLALILDGADIVIQQLTFNRGFHPIAFSVVPQEENPVVAQ